ncbi:hypothetical protein IFU40_06325 [Microbacterium sp. CFBP 13617]|uniref:hypothetical protein n=1 Tax=Microbacterium sp. CFBP 13617 TaxID=2774035 RepID=UPI00177D2732|nr:hypothetical protein [Microbacterium sp. CFBP 13617]MBD8218249.1 hypothetical protein [Microbacterium sp. CFBP 13617]
MSVLDTRPSNAEPEADLSALIESDDEAVCNRGDAAAVASLVVRCCGASYLVCDRHLRMARMRIEQNAFLCATCGTPYVRSQFDEVYRVVSL